LVGWLVDVTDDFVQLKICNCC